MNPTRNGLGRCRRTDLLIGVRHTCRSCSSSLRDSMIGIRRAKSSRSEPLDLSFFDLTQNLLLIQLELQVLQLCLNG